MKKQFFSLLAHTDSRQAQLLLLLATLTLMVLGGGAPLADGGLGGFTVPVP